MFRSPRLPSALGKHLRLPVVAAPMFLVSGPDLVIEACKAGVIGAFPSLNQRTTEGFETWVQAIANALDRSASNGNAPAPFGVNLSAHGSNQRLGEELDICRRHRVPLVISSGSQPGMVVDGVKPSGAIVFHDVINLYHARKAIASGVDGLVLVAGGAGGHAGALNPFAFLRSVREFYEGPIILGGGISDGWSVAAVQVLGADLAYMGTRFLATAESMAPSRYKEMVIDADPSDIVYTPAVSGVHGSFLRQSLEENHVDLERVKSHGRFDVGREFGSKSKAWRDIWSAGQGVGCITDTPSVSELCERLASEYQRAWTNLGISP